ncbi:hypothetical protein BVRB_6g141410 [Beta vulgaris subsp. vulgaris]|nr:hypothetical protein BVRB_6g141410 [Beta vulgaris subsp. vulgaris]
MVLGTVMSVVHSLLAALQCSQLKDICSILGYKSELDHLYETVIVARVVLLDAGAKQELLHEAQLWIQELKDVVYDADDLVDEFVTLAEQKHLIEVANPSQFPRHSRISHSHIALIRILSKVHSVKCEFE